MKLKLCIKAMVLSLVALILLNGCATSQPQQNRRYVWPRPPEQPRIEWLKSYYGQNDFPKSAFTEFVEVIFGSPAARIFDKPIDIKSNGKGIVYVTDIVAAGIFVFDLPGQKVEFWRQGSDPDAGLAIVPYYLAIDDDGNIYTVGTGRKDIFVLDPKGKLIRRIDFTGKVANPAGIAVDSKGGRIYLVDGGEAKVAVFDLVGKHLFSFGKPGEGDGEFNRPSPISYNHKGEVIVGDTINARVQIFDRDGKFLRKFGQRGDGPADFQIIKGVAYDSDDNIYVTDGKANQLKVYSTKGEFLIAIGTAYSVTKTRKEAPGGFLLPQGIHVDGTDTIYIADQANMRFQVFRYLKDSEAVKTHPLAPQAVK
jgi:DNA-binding beta-propeller fold protein YncE